jgi:hypothetical protein
MIGNVELETCLADFYQCKDGIASLACGLVMRGCHSAEWLHNADEPKTVNETLEMQFEVVRAEVNASTVEQVEVNDTSSVWHRGLKL